MFLSSSKNPMTVAYSLKSDHNVLTRCLFELTRVEARLNPAQQISLAASCEKLAGYILQTSQSNAFAPLVLAVAHDIKGNGILADFHLAQSYNRGPSEQWLAQLRLKFLAGRDADSGPNPDVFRADINLLFANPRGHHQLAQLYLSHPLSKSEIDATITQYSRQTQKSFLAALRRVSGA